MLIPLNDWFKFCHLPIKGIIHIGAHDCEEQQIYDSIGITNDKVIWIEAMSDKVEYLKNKYNIHQLVASDQDDEEISFKITNNGQSSSILDLETHKTHHPSVYVTRTIPMKTSRMDTFIQHKEINMNNYNYLNLDIQGAELKALKGFGSLLNHIDYIYTEVNNEYLYKDCALMSELDDYLLMFGFQRVVTMMTEYQWGDAFYVKRPYLTCEIMGGLGNQLFQVATVLGLSLKNHMKPIFIESEQTKFVTKRPSYWKTLFRHLTLCQEGDINFNICNEPENLLSLISPDQRSNTQICGYFQTSKYFNDYYLEISKLLTLQPEDQNFVNVFINNLRAKYNNRKLISIHVRRTDYCNLGWDLPFTYYQRALKYFDTSNSIFAIFSDDINWCKERFEFLPYKEFIDNHHDYIELFMMNQCDAYISANSSFSWWGAYLGDPLKTKMTIVPNIDNYQFYCHRYIHEPHWIPN